MEKLGRGEGNGSSGGQCPDPGPSLPGVCVCAGLSTVVGRSVGRLVSLL